MTQLPPCAGSFACIDRCWPIGAVTLCCTSTRAGRGTSTTTTAAGASGSAGPTGAREPVDARALHDVLREVLGSAAERQKPADRLAFRSAPALPS